MAEPKVGTGGASVEERMHIDIPGGNQANAAYDEIEPTQEQVENRFTGRDANLNYSDMSGMDPA